MRMKRRRCVSNFHSIIWPRQSNSMTKLIHKLEKERDDGRLWSTSSDVSHIKPISRFRRYLEKHGTKKQKLDKIDDYVFDMFERARQKALPVHDIDLRWWALKQAMDESLHNFVASKHWLYAFKHKHNVVSRKITKVRCLKLFLKNLGSKLSSLKRDKHAKRDFKFQTCRFCTFIVCSKILWNRPDWICLLSLDCDEVPCGRWRDY